MSARAVLWALEMAPVEDPTRALVLLGLCERSNDDGRGAWPSVEWLAKVARRDVRQVKRHLKALREADLIRAFDCQHYQYLRIRPDRRPVAWSIAVPALPAPGGFVRQEREVMGDTPSSADDEERGDTQGTSGVSPRVERGDTQGQNGVSPMTPEPEEEPEGTRTGEPERASAPASGPPDAEVIDLRSWGIGLARETLRARRGGQS